MAGKAGGSKNVVDFRFLENPVGLDFFQVARKVECRTPAKPRIGHGTRSADDPIQFGQEPSLAFAPSTLHSYQRPNISGKGRLMVNFFGLCGPQGPLPLHITEYIHDRELNHNDYTLSRFLDIFNHRMISLFYRAWACNQQTVSHDRSSEDRFSNFIGSLIGIGTAALRNRDDVPDMAKLHFSGHLTCQTRHAEGLRAILKQYFGIEVTIKEFIGQWIIVPEMYRCRLGQSPDTASLGVNTVVGSRVWDCQQKFRITMGPMSLKDYERMLPGRKSFAQLKSWVRNYVGDALNWELQLILKASEVPAVRLGEAGRLGWTTWLRSQPFENDVEDMLIPASAA